VLRMVASLENQGEIESKTPVAEAAETAQSEAAPAAAEEIIEYKSVKYLTRKEAIAIDEELMDEDGGWSLPVLMELAGKSIADAIYDAYPPKGAVPHPVNGNCMSTVLIVCGKGNNGGDGLVAGRHLKMYGYDVQVVYPERKNAEPFRGLVTQLKNADVNVNLGMPGGAYGISLVVDCAFGFNYKKPLRAPWDMILKQLTNPEFFGDLPCVSVDVPLGWNVNRGPDEKSDLPILQPDMLVSLTAPKGCAIGFKGQHYLGGRFIPYRMNIKYQLGLFNAPYTETRNFVKLPDQAPASARSEFLKRLVAEGDDEDDKEAAPPPTPKAPSAGAAARQAEAAKLAAKSAAAAAAAAAPVAAFTERSDLRSAVVSDVPDLDMEDAFEDLQTVADAGADADVDADVDVVPEVWRPPVWDEPNDNIQTAIADMNDDMMTILGEKRDGWPAKLRNLMSVQVIPLGWESDYPPDKTTVSKIVYLGAKSLSDKGFDNADLLSEGRLLAENAFEEGGDMEGGKMMKAYANLYGVCDDLTSKKIILEDFARMIKAKGYPEDLVPVPQAPDYGFKDKWSIKITEPPAMGGQEIEVVVRPKQSFKVLANAWLKMNNIPEDNVGDYEFLVPTMPKTWRSGVIDINDEIGDTGLLDGNGFTVVITNPDIEMSLQSAQA